MKKTLILTCLIFLIIGCKKENINSDEDNNSLIERFSPFSKKRVHIKELKLDEKIYYYEGKPFDGIAFDMADEKKIEKELSFKDGKLDGISKKWFFNGKPEFVYDYKQDKLNGKQQTWFENGQLKEESNYKNGVLNGNIKTWYENGQLASETNYQIIKRKPLANGELVSIDQFGNENELAISIGVVKEWHKNGQLASLMNYNKQGNQNGSQTRWYDDGKYYEISNFKNGKGIGKLQRWYNSGQIGYEKNFSTNLEKEWYNDGVLKSEEIEFHKNNFIKIRRNYYGNGEYLSTDSISK
ncbi:MULTISPECIES: toxin-antitoxin system YwqK family antitoxin [unclassified Flavobacterium]|jgi:antitoxin component YwqK of YwqJK toxin-antitoxin module|uniref:toxin-antitoxin system YwqK family antitoxin n=1 Tax=unclassified Flavobacterium TaxID=196869 RepID=UPI0025C1B18A|nr:MULTISPECIES: toxin-antitoxin system YwqK family antitoxin [unclassified Flavobacterium]